MRPFSRSRAGRGHRAPGSNRSPRQNALLVGLGAATAACLATGVVAAVASGNDAGDGVTASYQRVSAWDTGFQGEYTITNTGSAATHGWSLEFDLPAGARVSSLWGGTSSATSGHVTVTPQSWDADLAPTGTVSVGFVATGPGTEPGGCLINGQTCAPSTSPTGTASGTASPGPTPSATKSPPSEANPTTAAPTVSPTTPSPTGPAATRSATPTDPATSSPPSGPDGGSVPAAAPYVDTSLFPPFNLVTTSKTTGLKVFNLAFVVGGGGCTPLWGGVTAIGNDAVAAQLSDLRAAGGDARVSFGGAAGRELAQACSSTADLVAAYQKVISAYGLTKIDFDVEGAAIADSAANARRAGAVATLQKNAKAAGQALEVSLTLPVLPTGLTQDGLNVVSGMASAGVNVSAVNIMAMDYGDGAAPNPAGKMGQFAIDAATATQAQVKQALGGTDAQAWAKVAVTPMIGVNDTSTEVFTVADAQQLVAFARIKHLAWLSMWSGARDKACPGGPKSSADATCSSIAQADLAFSKVLAGYQG